MSKCDKITPKEVIEVAEWTKDDFIRNSETEGHSLQTPEVWLRRKYTLTMFTLAHDDAPAGVNHLASLIFNRLDDDDGTEATICGLVIICNERDGECLDFEMADFNYTMSVLYSNSQQFNLQGN